MADEDKQAQAQTYNHRNNIEEFDRPTPKNLTG